MKRHSIIAALSLIVLLSGVGFAAQSRWELLGRQEVDFKRDHDRINVGRHEGRFKELRVRVKGGSVEMNRMVVTFANGETFSPQLKHRFEEGADSKVIDLPGDRRTIQKIDFNYRSTNRREGKAVVEVYGR